MNDIFKFSVRAALTIVAAVGCVCLSLPAQDSQPPSLSLGDLARQGRAQHPSSGQSQPSAAQDLVDDMQRQQEEAGNAPVGFASFDAGAYRLFVPYPSTLEGRESGGAVLVGSRLGLTNTEVLAGVPVPMPPNLTAGALRTFVNELASRYGPNASCSPATLGSHNGFRCSWSNTPRLLGHEVWGTIEFIVGSSTVIPVMCVSPDDIHQCVNYDAYGYHTCNNRRPSWDEVQKTNAAIATRFRDELTTDQMCKQVIYPSIQLKEDIVVHPATMADGASAKVRATKPLLDQGNMEDSQSTSLAELARQTRQTPRPKAQAMLDDVDGSRAAPAGFQSFALSYCTNPQQCSQATVVVPEKVEVISGVNGQYVFKASLDGGPIFLYAGPADVNAPYRSLTNPDFMRIRDLANPNGWSREKAEDLSTQELTIEGRPALITRFRYEREPKKLWIGERTVIENQGKQFLLGCTASEQNFAEAEVLCTTLVNSLRLP